MDMLKTLAATDGLWASYPARRARAWFVVRLIAASVAEGQLRGRLEQARDIVAPLLPPDVAWFRPEWELAYGAEGGRWSAQRDSELRAEILYGLLGLHPQFFDHLPYLYFVARRLYRIVMRVTRFVDPLSDLGEEGKEGFVFVYPPQHSYSNYKLNPQCTGYWIKRAYDNVGIDRRYPFVLTTEGRAHPAEAITRLFTAFPKPIGPGSTEPLETDQDGYDPTTDRRNFLGCESVATAVHLDSLLAAADPAPLLADLVGRGNEFLRIDHPLGVVTYSPDAQPGVVGALFVIEEAAVGEGSLRVAVDGNLAPFILRESPVRASGGRSFLPVGVRRADGQIAPLRLRIEDGRPPPAAEVVITGVAVEPTVPGANGGSPAITRETRDTGWLEVEPLPRNISPGTRLTDLNSPAPHALIDPDPARAWFETAWVARIELIPGDHIYLPNHPLYRSILTGAWQGEHSFVTGIERRRDDLASEPRPALTTGGHGLSGELTEVAANLLDETNEHLSLIAEIVRRHVQAEGRSGVAPLCTDGTARDVPCDASNVVVVGDGEFSYFPFRYWDPLKWDPLKGASGGWRAIREIKQPNHDLPDPFLKAGEVVEYELPAQQSLFDNERNPAHTNRKPDALVVMQRPDDPYFWFWYLGKRLYIQRTGTDANELLNWTLDFLDPRLVLIREFALFSPNAIPRRAVYDDLQGLFPIYDAGNAGRILVLRPRIDFSPAYQNRLQQLGCLPEVPAPGP